ncbi:MAG TPA: MBL fold metallo-hydrolase, partial [Chloroflexota bacterium]|nr:MBL fold metallo-hydrolase [Chloroflexota bacterium]
MHIKITTLAENTAAKMGVLAEHGLSMLVEVDDLCLLLDTGQTDTVVRNARVLGVDLSRVQHIVLSHGHSDHTGGLLRVLAETGEVIVHAHQEVFRPRYGTRGGGKPRYTGLPHLREQLESMGARFQLSEGPDRITPQAMTTGPVPRITPFEHVDVDLKVRTPRGLEQDEIPDDQSLLIKT